MADHFALQVDVASLLGVEKTLTEIAGQLQDEGGKLAGMPGSAGDWTGNTATTLKTAMSTLAADMRQSKPHFDAAVSAVATFRMQVEDALESVAGLNASWATADSTYSTAVTSADNAYTQAKTGTPSGVFNAEEPDLARTRASAKSQAQTERDTSQRWLAYSYSAIVQMLQGNAATCSQALGEAVSRAVPPDVVQQHLTDSTAGYGFAASAYLTGGSPFPSQVEAVEQELVDKGILPPQCTGMTAAELQQYLKDNPDVARALAQNAPAQGDPGSPETQLALLMGSYDPNATGAAAETQRTQFRELFETMSPQDQLLLATLFPTQTGNTGGVPFAARSAANYVSVVVANDDLQKQIDMYVNAQAADSDYISPDAMNEKYAEILAPLRAQQALYQGVLDDPSRVILLFDAQAGRFAEASGPIDDTTTDVAIAVPGTGTNLSNIQGTVDRFGTFSDASGSSLVTISWMGGPLPQAADAALPDYANALGPQLAEFTKEVRQEVGSSPAAGNGVELTLSGHSYGGEVVGVAQTYNADSDRVLYIEAAGMGYGIDPEEQNPANPDQAVYSMTAPGDFIEMVQGVETAINGVPLGTGGDPDTWPGTVRLETGTYPDGTKIEGWDAHSGVFTEGSTAWQQMYEVYTGGQVTVYGGLEPPKIYIAGGQGSGVWIDNPAYNPHPETVDVP